MKNNKSINPLFTSSPKPRILMDQLEFIESLLEDHKSGEALEQLLFLNRKYPNNLEILSLTAWAYNDLKNVDGCLKVILQMDLLTNNSLQIKYLLADAYLKNNFLALGLQLLRKINKHWPQNDNFQKNQDLLEKLELDLEYSSKLLDFSLEPGIEFYAKHEEIQILMSEGKYKRCKQIGAELLTLRPEFAPVHNNLSHVCFLEGNIESAIENSQKVLNFQPQNVHTLYSLCCYNFMLGNHAKLKPLAKKLINAPVLSSDDWGKKVRGLCFIGDDEGVVNVLEMAKNEKEYTDIDGLFWHWCAVAEYRRGNLGNARTYWKKCVKQAPFYVIAQQNLNEIKKPNYERDCPQDFSVDSWFSTTLIDEFISEVEKFSKQRRDFELVGNANSLISKFPQLPHFIRAAIMSGDRLSKGTALQLIEVGADTETMNWLKKYSMGKEGSDQIRFEISQILSRIGVFENGQTVKMWSKGILRPILMLGFNIIFDKKSKTELKPKVIPIVEDAIEALRDENGSKAENLFRKAIQIQSNDPSLQYNLAVSLKLQNKVTEAEALIGQIASEFPDYLFVQVIKVRRLIANKDFKKGQAVLDKIMLKKEFHVTEFSALCACQIDLSVAEGKPDTAETWYEVWNKVYPEDPSIKYYDWLAG